MSILWHKKIVLVLRLKGNNMTSIGPVILRNFWILSFKGQKTKAVTLTLPLGLGKFSLRFFRTLSIPKGLISAKKWFLSAMRRQGNKESQMLNLNAKIFLRQILMRNLILLPLVKLFIGFLLDNVCKNPKVAWLYLVDWLFLVIFWVKLKARHLNKLRRSISFMSSSMRKK